jgi:hypothetical protein
MRFLLIIFGLLLFSGCSSTSVQNFGNYSAVVNTNQALVSTIANDVVEQIQVGNPPSTTMFYFTHKVEDNFGITIQDKLRSMGYAIADHSVERVGKGKTLSYVIDNFDETTLLVRIYSGNKTFSRLYNVEQNMAVPAGAWSRME